MNPWIRKHFESCHAFRCWQDISSGRWKMILQIQILELYYVRTQKLTWILECSIYIYFFITAKLAFRSVWVILHLLHYCAYYQSLLNFINIFTSFSALDEMTLRYEAFIVVPLHFVNRIMRLIQDSIRRCVVSVLKASLSKPQKEYSTYKRIQKSIGITFRITHYCFLHKTFVFTFCIKRSSRSR
jgi:hypothetical protein